MEGKALLKRFFLALTACLLLALSLFWFLLVKGPGFPVSLAWGDKKLEISKISSSAPRSLHLSGIEFSTKGLKVRVLGIGLILDYAPPFFSRIVVERPEVEIQAEKGKPGRSLHISRRKYRLLRLVQIKKGKIDYVSPDISIRVKDVDFKPDLKETGQKTTNLSLFSASYELDRSALHLQGSLDGRLDFSTFKAGLKSLSAVRAPGLSSQVPVRLSLDFSLPEELDSAKGAFSVEISHMQMVPALKKTGITGRFFLDGMLAFSRDKGLKARGRVSLPLDEMAAEAGLPVRLGAFQLYSLESPRDLSRISLALQPEKERDTKTRVRLDYEMETGSWVVDSDIQIQGLSGSKDADHAFEDLDLRLKFKLKGQGRKASWTAAASWDKGQVLMYPWFFDLSELKGSVTAGGTLNKKGVLVSRAKMEGPFLLDAKDVYISLKDDKNEGIGSLLKNIRIGRLDLSGSLERLYPVFLRDPFGDSNPVLKKIDPSGSFKASTDGRVVELGCMADIRYSGSDLFNGLFFDFHWPFRDEKCRNGGLSWRDFYLQNLLPASLLDRSVKVCLRQNRIPMTICRKSISAGPVALDLQNGEISVKKAAFDMSTKNLFLEGISLEDLQIKRLVAGFPYEMRVSARDMSARLQGQRLVFSGKIRAEVAGGIIEASGIWIEPFAPIVHYGADIVFKDLDLKMLTAPTSFGVVSGVVRGHIKGLVMSGIQPERFDFRLESDESAKTPKKISIRAVENLSILGGGEGSVSFLGYFFKEFSYKRIGISCSLNNDLFVLHGLIKKGGREYLVERGFFGGVNVINMNPGGRIRFKDMVERLKRITETDNSKMEVR